MGDDNKLLKEKIDEIRKLRENMKNMDITAFLEEKLNMIEKDLADAYETIVQLYKQTHLTFWEIVDCSSDFDYPLGKLEDIQGRAYKMMTDVMDNKILSDKLRDMEKELHKRE